MGWHSIAYQHRSEPRRSTLVLSADKFTWIRGVSLPCIVISRYDSALGACQRAENVFHALRPWGQDTIFHVQALPYAASLTGDPWSEWAKGGLGRLVDVLNKEGFAVACAVPWMDSDTGAAREVA